MTFYFLVVLAMIGTLKTTKSGDLTAIHAIKTVLLRVRQILIIGLPAKTLYATLWFWICVVQYKHAARYQILTLFPSFLWNINYQSSDWIQNMLWVVPFDWNTIFGRHKAQSVMFTKTSATQHEVQGRHLPINTLFCHLYIVATMFQKYRTQQNKYMMGWLAILPSNLELFNFLPILDCSDTDFWHLLIGFDIQGKLKQQESEKIYFQMMKLSENVWRENNGN